MKRNVLMVMAVLMVASLSACNRGERATLTGSYGESVIAGQVTMAEGLGSPAGVEVSVRGTGMTAVLADDGRFTFAGVPSNAAFDFRRAADGIAATLSIPENQGFVQISLAKNEARPMKRRGGPGETQLEGIVRSITATELVLTDSRLGEKSVRLTATTVILKGNTVLTAAEVQPGWRVHVKATKAEDVYTAVQVIVQSTNSGDDDGENGDDRGAGFGREYEGIVRTATATSLVVATSRAGEVTFALTAETVIRKGSVILTAADIKPDYRVHVKASTAADGAKTAKLVIVQNTSGGTDDGGGDEGGDDDPPGIRQFEGTVRSASATALVVFTSRREEVTFVIDAQTEIRKGNDRLTAADLKADMRVHVKARVDGSTNTAVGITVQKAK